MISVSISLSCSKNSAPTLPQLISFYPLAEGPGLPLSIKGQHFGTDATKVSVSINGTAAVISQINDTMLVVTIPAGASTGRIMVTINGKQTSSNTDFSVLTGTWEKGGDNLPVARYGAASFAINGKGYIMGGSDYASYQKDFYSFDPATGNWTQLTDFPGEPRMAMISFVINNKAYICGGIGKNNQLFPQLWQFDPVTGIWTQKSTYPGGGATSFINFSINGKEYMGGGYNLDSLNIGSVYTDFWAYSTRTCPPDC